MARYTKAQTTFTLSWLLLVLAALGIPATYILLQFIKGWAGLGVLVWGMIYIGVMGFLSLLAGVVAARRRQLALVWVIPLWIGYAVFAGAIVVEKLERYSLHESWLQVAGFSAVFLVLVLSLVVMPKVLGLPVRIQRAVYRAAVVVSAALLLMALPDLLL